MSTRHQRARRARPQPTRPAKPWWRRRWRLMVPAFAVTLLIGASVWIFSPTASAAGTPITVYKSPSCTCCAKWVDHLRENGFAVDVRNARDLARIRQEQGVPAQLASCHTSVAAGYAVEGHVPADLIRTLLEDRPPVSGLAVPGMPSAAPGMGETGPRYDVLAFAPDGSMKVFARR